MSCNVKNTLSELVLSAVFTMQQKNGVSLMQIIDYIAEKRGCDQNEIRSTVRMVLTKAKQHGILSESRGMYRLEPSYEDKLDKKELKTKKEEKDTEENGEGKGADSQEKGNGETPPTCPTEADANDDCPEDNDEDEEDEEDNEGDENCDEEQKDDEEPLPKKGKFYENFEQNDADEDDGWATQVEKLLWNLSKSK